MAKLQRWGRRPSYKNLARPVNTNCIFNTTLSLKHNRQSLFSRAIAHTARGEGRPFVSRLLPPAITPRVGRVYVPRVFLYNHGLATWSLSSTFQPFPRSIIPSFRRSMPCLAMPLLAPTSPAVVTHPHNRTRASISPNRGPFLGGKQQCAPLQPLRKAGQQARSPRLLSPAECFILADSELDSLAFYRLFTTKPM